MQVFPRVAYQTDLYEYGLQDCIKVKVGMENFTFYYNWTAKSLTI